MLLSVGGSLIYMVLGHNVQYINPVLRSLTYFVSNGCWFYLWCNYCYTRQCH